MSAGVSEGRFVRLAPLIAGRVAGNLASGIVPEARSDASKLVKLAPLIAGSVPVKFAAGRLVRLAPEPLKVVAVAVPSKLAFPTKVETPETLN